MHPHTWFPHWRGVASVDPIHDTTTPSKVYFERKALFSFKTCMPFYFSSLPLFFGKIRFVPPQLREIGCHVQNHATQWHGFQHEIQLQEIGVAWIKMTPFFWIS